MDKRSLDGLRAKVDTGVMLGSLQRTAEGMLVFGHYKAQHKRISPEYAGAAKALGDHIARVQHSAPRVYVARLVSELEAMPRTLIGEYDAPNLVTDVGARLLLDTILAGSAFTASTFMGLKGTGSAAVGDTQASHAGWSEVGATNAPQYTSPRKTVTWSAASGTGAGLRSKASSGTYTYAIITAGGTVDGAFLNINGASTIDNTTGTLFSAGTFSGGSKTVAISDTLTVTYTLSL
jgi:hypothetical protein